MDTDATARAPRGPASDQTPRTPRENFGRGRGGRGRGRGRGQPFRGNPTPQKTPQPSIEVPSAPTSNVATEDATEPEQKVDAPQQEGELDVEAEVCFICASPVVHNAIAPCNHRTCHMTTSEFVIFTDDSAKRYEDFTDTDFTRSDETLGIKYEKNEIVEDTVILLRYNCPDPSCDVACYGWPDLHRHVKSVHHKQMCDLCTRNKKVFTHEHELFTPATLRKHERYGDDNPGAIDQSGFKGHPECGFCRERFYGDDELYVHCREKHERCHICDRQAASQNRRSDSQQYYLDYPALEIHFSKDHYLCPDKKCLEKKFIVFDNEIDLKVHQQEAHPHGLSKDARRDARLVDMRAFDYRTPHQQDRRGGRGDDRGGRARGRGRDPNTDEAIPTSSAQPMRRDELAYQRQLAVHSAQSISNRTFGGQLTSSSNAVTARAPADTRAPATVTAPRTTTQASTDPPSLDALTLNGTTPRTPADHARTLRHTAITERASNLLHNSPTGLTTFRTRISDYRSSKISAPALIDAFFVLFDCSSADLGKLIHELAEIFEVPGKKDSLLKAWNDWRALNEDYPSLPALEPTVSGASGGGKRILKLKSSTQQSSRSAVGRHASWGSAGPIPRPGAGSGSSKPAEAFPAMPKPTSNGAAGKARQPGPWGRSTTAEASKPAPTPSPAPAPLRAKPSAAPKADAFPALPAGQKLSMNATRPGFSGNPVIRRTANSGASTPVNAWSNGLVSPSAIEQPEPDLAAASGKKKGKNKQILAHWG